MLYDNMNCRGRSRKMQPGKDKMGTEMNRGMNGDEN